MMLTESVQIFLQQKDGWCGPLVQFLRLAASCFRHSHGNDALLLIIIKILV
jgi:hypothetical protein